MSESSYFDASDIFLKHATFHLTGARWDALNRLVATWERHSSRRYLLIKSVLP